MVENAFMEALKGFLEKIGAGGITPDADGTLELTFDDIPVTLTCRESAPDDVYCHAIVASLEGLEDDAVLLNDFLEANFFWEGTAGGTLGIVPGTTDLVLTDRREASYFTDADTLGEWLGAFIKRVRDWREYTAKARTGAANSESTEEVAE